jgi:hypothetical protein
MEGDWHGRLRAQEFRHARRGPRVPAGTRGDPEDRRRRGGADGATARVALVGPPQAGGRDRAVRGAALPVPHLRPRGCPHGGRLGARDRRRRGVGARAGPRRLGGRGRAGRSASTGAVRTSGESPATTSSVGHPARRRLPRRTGAQPGARPSSRRGGSTTRRERSAVAPRWRRERLPPASRCASRRRRGRRESGASSRPPPRRPGARAA